MGHGRVAIAQPMALSNKVKTGLDETRTLILGAQILLGFQFNGAFEARFDALSPPAKLLNAIALGMMLASVGVLIAPSAFHRIADHGESTGRMQVLTGRCAEVALLPFSIALGLDLAIALSRTFGGVAAGLVGGTGFAVIALMSWYGLGELMKQHLGADERLKAEAGRAARETAPLHVRIEQMLTEARVILPGAQALLGFQLAMVLTDAFERLPSLSRALHGAALLCVSLSVVLLITPAAMHRIVWAGEDAEPFLRHGGVITVLALLPLAAGMAVDSYVVLVRMTDALGVAAAAAALVLLWLVGMWLVWPIMQRWAGRRRAAGGIGTGAARLGEAKR
jgi:hypothetical protein